MNKRVIQIVFLFAVVASCDSIDADSNEVKITKPTFETSVAIVSRASAANPSMGKSTSEPLSIELINFDSTFKLPAVLKVDDIEYCDNGKFNDKIPGDGIYTSIEIFSSTDSRKNTSDKIAFATAFEHRASLKEHLLKTTQQASLSKKSGSVTLSCDVVERPCPQTTWYNTCWFSDTCTCVYLENCKFEISVDF